MKTSYEQFGCHTLKLGLGKVRSALHKLAHSGVTALLDHAEFITGWVSTKICLCEKMVDRANLLLFFTNVAASLRDLENANGFMALMKGLTIGPVKVTTPSYAFTKFSALPKPSRYLRAKKRRPMLSFWNSLTTPKNRTWADLWEESLSQISKKLSHDWNYSGT